jgi:uroporphyrinogen-III decarboxylase
LFDRTNMKAAKEKIGGFACIGGNVPASLFATGTPEMMENYCKELIDIAAPGGGFFLSPGAVIDQAKPENMSAYLNITQKFGVY